MAQSTHLSSRETLLSNERKEFLVLPVTEMEMNNIFVHEKLREFCSSLCFDIAQTKAKYDIIPKK